MRTAGHHADRKRQEAGKKVHSFLNDVSRCSGYCKTGAWVPSFPVCAADLQAEDEQEKIGPDAVKEEAPAAGAPTEPARPAAAANEVGGVHEENKQEGEESVPLPADPTGEEVKDSGTKAVDEVEAAGKETAEGEEQKGAEGGPARERDATEGPDTKGGAAKEVDGGPTDDGSKDGGAGAGDDDGLVVCYLKPEGSVSHRLLVNCGVLPLPLDKAKEVIPEFKPVSSPAELQDVVVGNGKTQSQLSVAASEVRSLRELRSVQVRRAASVSVVAELLWPSKGK